MARGRLPRSTMRSPATRTTSPSWSSARPGSGPPSITARPSSITSGRCGESPRTLRASPPRGEALTGLGVLLSRRGLWSDALPPLRRATEVDPGHAAAWYYLGEALNHVDDLTAAQAAYERAVELEPRNARALHRLGIVLDRLNRPAEATRMYRRSREAAAR